MAISVATQRHRLICLSTHKDIPYLQNLMSFAGHTELFSTIVPIFDCALLKCQEVKTNARWSLISQIYEHSVSTINEFDVKFVQLEAQI